MSAREFGGLRAFRSSGKYLRAIPVICHSWQHTGIQPAFRASAELVVWTWLKVSFRAKANATLVPAFTTVLMKAEALSSSNVILKWVCCMNQPLKMALAVQNLNSYISLSVRKDWSLPVSHRNSCQVCFHWLNWGLRFWCIFLVFRSCSGLLLKTDREKFYPLFHRHKQAKSLLVCKTKKNFIWREIMEQYWKQPRRSVAWALKMKGSGTEQAGNYGRLWMMNLF